MLGCWVTGMNDSWPSVWCSKYYFFFIISCKILCKNPFKLFIFIFYKITKLKIRSFECPKSIRNYEKKKTWNVNHLVDDSFVPSAQQTSILYSRLTEFISMYNNVNMYNDIYISWWLYFILQQRLTAELAKTKADIAKKSSYCYFSHCWVP